MPFRRRPPTEAEIAALEAASYAALENVVATGTQTEKAFRATLALDARAPAPTAGDRRPVRGDDDDDARAAAAAFASDAAEIAAAARVLDAAAERVWRASVGRVAAPDEGVEDAAENATTGGRLSLDAGHAAPSMLTDNFTAAASDDERDAGDDDPALATLPASSDDEPDDDDDRAAAADADAAPQPKEDAPAFARGFLDRAAPDRRARAAAPPPPPPDAAAVAAAAARASRASGLPEFLPPPPPPPPSGDVSSDPVEAFALDPAFDYDNAPLSTKPTVEEEIRRWEVETRAGGDGVPAPAAAADDDDDDDDDDDEKEEEEYILVDETNVPEPDARGEDDLSELEY